MKGRRSRRVVITGLGVIAPNGQTLDTFWNSVARGQSCVGPITRFEVGDSPVHMACELRGFHPGDYMEARVARRLDRSTQYAMAAGKSAVVDSGLDLRKVAAERVGIVEGTTVSTLEAATRSAESWKARGHRGISLFAMINGYSGSGSGELAMELGIKGHAITLSSGSASGNDVMGYAMTMIRDDEADVMLAGGAEAPIQPLVWGAFIQSRVLAADANPPGSAMKPFDISRNGFVLGEGAGFVVMEELTHALGRGARIYAEVLGQGRACEAYHPVAPDPEATGPILAMQRALAAGQTGADQVDYINAHGTATEANDLVETRAIKKFFGPVARRIAVTSTKPVTGHLMAAAGAVETVVTALALHRQVIPPTANHRIPAPECDLDYVPQIARPYPIRVALNLSCGFGGKNSCLALRSWHPQRE
jgi:3-oxoacyl-[acyl-carrier-protein] synthase II